MKHRRQGFLRQDLRFGVSALLLAGATMAAVTGFAADFWALNDFLLHTVSGYVMASLASERPRCICWRWERHTRVIVDMAGRQAGDDDQR